MPLYIKLSDEAQLKGWAGELGKARLPDRFLTDYVRVYDLVDAAADGPAEPGRQAFMDTVPNSSRWRRSDLAGRPARALLHADRVPPDEGQHQGHGQPRGRRPRERGAKPEARDEEVERD